MALKKILEKNENFLILYIVFLIVYKYLSYKVLLPNDLTLPNPVMYQYEILNNKYTLVINGLTLS